MWELERTFVKRHPAPVTLRASRRASGEQNAGDQHGPDQDAADDPLVKVLAIVGRGRLGTALVDALHTARLDAEPQGPFGRGYDGRGADVVLLCVPDAEIAAAAQLIVPGPLVGHCSGATALTVLAPHEAFSFHPLLPVIPGRTSFADAGAAVAGTTPQARAFATALARGLGMRPVEIEEQDRAAYHAAASVASNFLVTLEAAAEALGATAGLARELLVPLVRATVDNWAQLGPEAALTGPVARGDQATVAAQRLAVAERVPQLLPLFDALVEETRALASQATSREQEPATR